MVQQRTTPFFTLQQETVQTSLPSDDLDPQNQMLADVPLWTLLEDHSLDFDSGWDGRASQLSDMIVTSGEGSKATSPKPELIYSAPATSTTENHLKLPASLVALRSQFLGVIIPTPPSRREHVTLAPVVPLDISSRSRSSSSRLPNQGKQTIPVLQHKPDTREAAFANTGSAPSSYELRRSYARQAKGTGQTPDEPRALLEEELEALLGAAVGRITYDADAAIERDSTDVQRMNGRHLLSTGVEIWERWGKGCEDAGTRVPSYAMPTKSRLDLFADLLDETFGGGSEHRGDGRKPNKA
ncbi:hypothetical protein H0H81_001356 [Sphagnurus paluster]|uniref:Uncharacterized protein n=1 Tax=Sphagnurus paluster TaxID=117069 RepID=A0A9P7GUQ3_9AGAR|nr:hypothetical protein H0H81_001356 [Sphagnurus paluster]